jgi:3-oxoacyl-[acyl-carrier-protein] synthase-1
MSATIVAMGAVTAVGLSAPAAIAAQRAGISGQAEHPYMLDGNGEPMRVAKVPWGDTNADIVSRLVELALLAAHEALAAAPSEQAIDVMLALPEARPGLPDGFGMAVGTRFSDSLRASMAVGKVRISSRGHAGGLALIGEAAAAMGTEDDKLVLVGGTDSWLAPETLEWLDSIEALHSDTMPWGFCPGEAAAFCLLASAPAPAAHLTIAGSGQALETNRIRTETVCIGAGLSAAWRSALSSLSRSGQPVHQIWCDLNSEPYRGDELAFSVARVREHLANDVDIVTPADTWGDVGAASGPLLLLAAELAAAKNYAAGPVSLLSTSSDGGLRTALLAYDRWKLSHDGRPS